MINYGLDMSTAASNNSRYTGRHADFVKKREQAAKAANRRVQHNLIKQEVEARKRDNEWRTVTLKGGRRVKRAELKLGCSSKLSPRSNDLYLFLQLSTSLFHSIKTPNMAMNFCSFGSK